MSGWRDKGSRHSRGYGRGWETLRQAVMERDSYLCQPCSADGRITAATAVDHIVPKSQGGSDDMTNLQAICTACHADKTTREAASAQGRTVRDRIRYDRDGRPIW